MTEEFVKQFDEPGAVAPHYIITANGKIFGRVDEAADVKDHLKEALNLD